MNQNLAWVKAQYLSALSSLLLFRIYWLSEVGMVDLEKKNFDVFWAKASQTLDADSYDAFEIWLERAKQAQAEITELKQQIKGLKDLNIDLQYSRQRVRVELSDLDGVFTELKQKLEKIESGELVLVPRIPTNEMVNAYKDTSIAPMATLSLTGYKAMIEAVEKDHE